MGSHCMPYERLIQYVVVIMKIQHNILRGFSIDIGFIWGVQIRLISAVPPYSLIPLISEGSR